MEREGAEDLACSVRWWGARWPLPFLNERQVRRIDPPAAVPLSHGPRNAINGRTCSAVIKAAGGCLPPPPPTPGLVRLQVA